MKYIYQRVRDIREDHDKTQRDMAKYLNVHLNQYRRWETGESEIPAHILIRLSQYYNCSIDYLLSKIEIKKEP